MRAHAAESVRRQDRGEPQPVFTPPPALAGTDARRGLDVALNEVRTDTADSGAVLIVRKAQRCSLPLPEWLP
jgi:hypothetical protein